jgi:LacI family transcriptional regulator, repressor for deo operon, udp, cdd, tsx, nupC, and nupG
VSERPGPGGGRTVTIADVAALAGVSTATVSRALAKPDSVRTETVAQVMEAVRASGYTPNSSARMLRTQRTNMVLVVVPSIANQMYSHVLRGVDTVLAPAGYGVIIGNLDSAPGNQARFVELAFARQVDAVILLCGYIPGSRGRTLAETGLPMVSLCAPIGDPTVPDICADDEAGGREAGRFLASLGHRHLAYAAGPAGSVVDTARWTSFQEGAVAGGVRPDAIVRLEGSVESRFGFVSGLAAGGRFVALERRPTAVFCASDEIAMGLMKALRQAGLRVPRDVSVVGFDGIDQADYLDPVLSTLRQPRQEIGRRGAEVLLRMLDGTVTAADRKVRLPVELLSRESTAPLRQPDIGRLLEREITR